MLQQFLKDLLEGRQVRVSDPQPISQEAKDEAVSLLSDFELEYRVTLPGDPPAFDSTAAAWSASALYTASSLLVYRDRGKEVVDKLLDMDPPDRNNTAAHYAVDLTMRFLPDLLKLAKSAATDDPLVERLKLWAVAWPLSSVGIDAVGPVDATPLRSSPTLMLLYVDRVMMTGDHSRLDDPAVAEAVGAALGDYPELCPSLAKELANQEAKSTEC